jgi:hypothetical protein
VIGVKRCKPGPAAACCSVIPRQTPPDETDWEPDTENELFSCVLPAWNAMCAQHNNQEEQKK